MDALHSLFAGFETALTPLNLLWALIGVTLGTLVGVLPGIGPALTVALLLPVTAKLPPVSAFIMFAGIYYGGMFGGSTTSILLNTPGESSSIITALEGNKMARRGRAAAALATAAIGSFVAGTIGTALLTFAAPAIAEIAVQIPPSAKFALIMLAFVTISATFGGSPLRGLTSLFLGLAVGLIGTDLQSGQARFTLGFPELLDGIDFITVVIGLFAIGETLYVASRLRRDKGSVIKLEGGASMSREDWRRSWKPWLRGTALGFPFGAIPAGGAEIPTFLSYTLEKRLTRRPEEFGKGAIEGVAGPEAANNAAAAGVLVPLLTLGLPTSATAAILLAAFQQYGLQPGPLLFVTNGDLVWGLIASLYIGNVMLLALNLPLAPVWARLLLIPRPFLYAGILVFSTVGVYSLNNSVFDLFLLALFGVIGYGMRRFDFPVTPAIIGVILGPVAEAQFRTALQQSNGDFSIFARQPLTAGILLIVAMALILPPVLRMRAARRAALRMRQEPV
ncbi:tripartite tricarboxylate transporter permease [Deinococcus metallilatus]|uniref:Tricarboxylic transport membrane protein n=1 Tax=Deinococcus metallilatus TaxID=1211322 RepID=A0AAJ5F2I5_9DEIO|nr:tripartite tricarboxylate transporter permease [Deinococcus metallilatus]MBB5295227.1 putative tricarboxylic transport membrane protein [Deinococcus metallilatus]QBY08611.1 tripartite tricarboxylate transporter permease [Deinococcus metallilatus]RXJ10490.1 tripartite tricarboxylate transporter permease [Deinococcus metallilatus]TLK26461.1 tripartite tricarboxylate transporter permease [Deinococcus metallilatus]GMA15001.1 tripartite tricarboxylate transporter TctA [Deinococcus metallilatus]